MAFRPDIIAGRAVILVNIEDTIDKQLRGIRAKLRRFSNSLGDIGGDLFRFGTVGVIGSFFPVKEFVEFQDQLLFIQTKLQATDQEMLVLESTIRDLGKATSFTSKEVGQAAQKLAQAGFSLSETQDSLQAALDLARGGQVDLSTSTDILANNIRTFQLNTEDASEVASKFITAARLGTLDIVDLNEAIKNSATTFRLLGTDLSTSLALITRLSTASLRGTIAGTSLNRAFQKLASENEKLANAGITLEAEDLKNPLLILGKIEQVLKNLNEQEGVTFLNDLLGIRGGRGLGGILIQGLGPLDDIIQQIRQSTDEARISAEKLDSRLGGVFRRANSSFQEFLLAVGSTSEGPLSVFGESLRKAFNELSLLSQENPRLVQSILLIPPAMIAAGAAMLTFAFAIDKVASAITPLISINSMLFSGLYRAVAAPGDFLGMLTKGITMKKLAKLPGVAAGKGILATRIPFAESLKTIASVGPRALDTLIKFDAFTRSSKGLWMRPLMNIGGKLAGGAGMIARGGANIAMGAPRTRDLLGIGGGVKLFIEGLRKAPQAIRNSRNAYRAAIAAGTIPGVRVYGNNLIEQTIKSTKKGLLRGYNAFFSSNTIRGATKVGDAIFGKRFGRNVPFLDTLFEGVELLGKSSLTRSLGGLFKVDYIRKLYVGITGLFKAFRGLFFVLNNIRRAVFSLSGFLTILELLIIIGPKIRPIREFFAEFGKFFKDLGNVAAATKPALETLGLGFQQLFRGDLQQGISTMKQGIGDLVDIVRTGLYNAWVKFTNAIKPTMDLVKGIGNGLLQVADTLVQIIGTVGGLAVNSLIPDITGEDSPFNIENINKFFAGLIEAIKVIGIQVLKGIGGIVKILQGISSILLSIFNLMPGSDNDMNPLDRNAARRRAVKSSIAGLEAEILAIQMNPSNFLPGNFMAANEQIRKYQAQIAALKKELEDLGPAPQTFAFNLQAAIAALQGITFNPFTPGKPGDAGASGKAFNFATMKAGLRNYFLKNKDAVGGLFGVAFNALQGAPAAVRGGIPGIIRGLGLQNTMNPAQANAQRKGILAEMMMAPLGRVGTLQEQLDELANGAPQQFMKGFLEGAGELWEVGKALANAIKNPQVQKGAEEIMATLSRIGTVGGSVAQTRGQLLKAVKNPLDVERNQKLDNIHGELQDMNANQLVFG